MELVDQKVAEGVPLEDVARELGLETTASLESAYRYDHLRIPKRTTIEKAARYFGVAQSEIYGDTDLDADPAFATVMGVLGKGLSDEWKEKLIEMAKLAQVNQAAEKKD